MKSEELNELKQVQTYRRDASAWFFSKEDPRWELSNMAGKMSLFWPLAQIRENEWNSSEQLYQASKYGTDVSCLPEANPYADPCVRNRIKESTNPRQAKMTQKCAVKAGLVRKDWEDPDHEVRITSMLWVLELKLFWNSFNFGKVLQQTADLPIVEISTKDDFWGCKVSEGGLLVGSNVLGKLLMRIRARSLEIKRRNFTYPDGWLLP